MIAVVSLQSLSLSVVIVTEIVTLLVISAAPSMAKGTTSVEPAKWGLRNPPLQDLRQALEPMAHGWAGNGVASWAARRWGHQGMVGDCQY